MSPDFFWIAIDEKGKIEEVKYSSLQNKMKLEKNHFFSSYLKDDDSSAFLEGLIEINEMGSSDLVLQSFIEDGELYLFLLKENHTIHVIGFGESMIFMDIYKDILKLNSKLINQLRLEKKQQVKSENDFIEISRLNNQLVNARRTLEKKNREIEDMLNKDTLTNIYSRHFFYSLVSKDEMDFKYLIVMDLDRFKLVNDIYGHQEGDRCLIIFAKLLESYFEDSIVARLGGDEFSVLTNYKIEEIKRILKSVEKEIKTRYNEVSVSYGVETVNRDSFENSYKNADKYMYKAKNAKKE